MEGRRREGGRVTVYGEQHGGLCFVYEKSGSVNSSYHRSFGRYEL